MISPSTVLPPIGAHVQVKGGLATGGLPYADVHRRWPDLAERRKALGLDHGWPGGETGICPGRWAGTCGC